MFVCERLSTLAFILVHCFAAQRTLSVLLVRALLALGPKYVGQGRSDFCLRLLFSSPPPTLPTSPPASCCPLQLGIQQQGNQARGEDARGKGGEGEMLTASARKAGLKRGRPRRHGSLAWDTDRWHSVRDASI